MVRRIAILLIVVAAFPPVLRAQCAISSLTWPLPEPFDPGHISLGFGEDWVKSCDDGEIKLHTGIDYPVASGTQVVAAESGTVIIAQLDTENIGWVTIDHGCFTTVNLHIIPTVAPGQWVNRGDPIGNVGHFPGGTPGDHLHFGIREAPYSNLSNRGALPRHICAGDPAYPEFFRNPAAVQYVSPDGSGTIEVKATLDGAPWSGPVSYSVSGAATSFTGTSTGSHPNLPAGGYTVRYLSGGPGSFVEIVPAASLLLVACPLDAERGT